MHRTSDASLRTCTYHAGVYQAVYQNCQSVDRVETVDGVDRVELVECIDCIDLVEHVDVVDRVEFVDFVDRVDCVDRVDRVQHVLRVLQLRLISSDHGCPSFGRADDTETDERKTEQRHSH